MDMSDFTAGTVGTGQDSAVDDDTSTDTGSQSNGYQIGIAFTTALPHFTQGCYIGIISSFHSYRQIQFFFQGLCQIKGTPANVHCTVDHIAVSVHCTGSSNSYAYQFFYRDILLLHFVFDRCCNIRQYLFPAVIFYCGNLPLIQHLSLIIEKS